MDAALRNGCNLAFLSSMRGLSELTTIIDVATLCKAW